MGSTSGAAGADEDEDEDEELAVGIFPMAGFDDGFCLMVRDEGLEGASLDGMGTGVGFAAAVPGAGFCNRVMDAFCALPLEVGAQRS